MTRMSFARSFLPLVLAVLAQPAAAQPAYTVTELGILDPTIPAAYPSAINASGLTVGHSSVRIEVRTPGYWINVWHAFRQGDAAIQDLGTFPNPVADNRDITPNWSIAYGVNSAGEAVGYSTDNGHSSRAVLFADQDGDGEPEVISLIADSTGSASAINDARRVVGNFAPLGSGNSHAFYLDLDTPGAGPVDIHTSACPNPGEMFSSARTVNARGDVAGACSGFTEAERGFFCEGGDTCVSLSWEGRPLVPAALNDSGKITGKALTTDRKTHAVVYSAGDVTDLGTLGGPVSGGLAVNSAGHVVGWSYDASYDSRAFLHDGQGMHDLNDLIPASSGWLLLSAAGINDAGQIVAQARKTGASGVFSVRLNPVSPAQRVAALVTLIEGFGLPDGIETSFTKKLEHALAALEAGDTATACGDLQDFINHASAQSGKKLTVEQAGRIIAEAEAVRAALGCS